MSRSRKRPPSTRGPNMGDLSKEIGYEDPKTLPKILLDFRHSRFSSSEDFSTCLDDQLIDLTNEFLATHGPELWPYTNAPPKPKYPADLKLIHKNVYEIYRRQRRNQSDVLSKKRKLELDNLEEDEDSELPNTSEVLSNRRDDYDQYTFYPMTSNEPSTASPSQPSQGQEAFAPTSDSIPIDPNILNGSTSHTAELQVSRKRTYHEMQNGATEDHAQRDDGVYQDQQHSSERSPRLERIVRLRIPQIGPIGFARTSTSHISRETIDLTKTTESDVHMSTQRLEQAPSWSHANDPVQSIDETRSLPKEPVLESLSRPKSASGQARLPRVVEYASALTQTNPISACSTGTQTHEANTKSQSMQTLQGQQRSIATQTIPVENSMKTYTYDDGYSAPIEGGCESAFALLTTIMDMIVDQRATARRKIRQAKTDVEKKLGQETANNFERLHESIQQEITLLGFQRVKTE